ncbi:MAG: hypothetical protein Q7U88_15635 [Desulfocapsaceae bacterium]|nr:hypothetical protein [Desulfocapsaceae bacterium]
MANIGKDIPRRRTGTRLEHTGMEKQKASNLLKLLAFIIYGGEGEIPLLLDKLLKSLDFQNTKYPFSTP